MSAVWNFFSKINNNRNASCNLCGKEYKTCGNTTNLAAHLKTKHFNAYLKLPQMKKNNISKTRVFENKTNDNLSLDNDDPDAEVCMSYRWHTILP